MRRNKKQVIYNEQSEEESPHSRHRSRDRSRDRDRERSSEREDSGSQQSQRQQSQQQEEIGFDRPSHKDQEITAENVATQIRSLFLNLFGRIKQEKGLVFTPQKRSDMIKQNDKKKNQRKIHWNPTCQWEIQQETNKIDKLFGKDFRGLDQQKMKLAKGIFLNVSYLFANETTQELYQIMLNILNIVLDKEEDSQEKVKKFMSLMLRDEDQYIFFNFKFSKYFKLKVDARTAEEAYHELGMNMYKEMKRALLTI